MLKMDCTEGWTTYIHITDLAIFGANFVEDKLIGFRRKLHIFVNNFFFSQVAAVFRCTSCATVKKSVYSKKVVGRAIKVVIIAHQMASAALMVFQLFLQGSSNSVTRNNCMTFAGSLSCVQVHV